MSIDTLHDEAKDCLIHIHRRFVGTMQGRDIDYPLLDPRVCRLFAACVSDTLSSVRSSRSRLPPTALILAMIRICQSMINPPAETFGRPRARVIPRAFAYEMLDRLLAEIPATLDFALDQIGRIITEAGTQSNETRVRKAFLVHQLRMQGAFASHDLDSLIAEVWHRRFPESCNLLDQAVSRAA